MYLYWEDEFGEAHLQKVRESDSWHLFCGEDEEVSGACCLYLSIGENQYTLGQEIYEFDDVDYKKKIICSWGLL